MNDLERDLRDVLGEDARRVPTPTSAPEGLRRSVRRRQAVFGGLVGLAGDRDRRGRRGGSDDAAPGSKRPSGRRGIDDDQRHPQRDHDHVPADLAPDRPGHGRSQRVPDDGRVTAPRIVLALAPMEAPETSGAPVGPGAMPLRC